MSELGLHPYKRAVLYDQISKTHVANLHPVAVEWSNAQHHVTTPPSKKQKLLLALIAVVGLHTVVWTIAQQFPTQPLPEKAPEPVVIEIIKPKEEPPKIIEPKIPPITKKVEIPPVQAKPLPPKPIEKPVVKQQPKPVVQEKPIEQPVVKTSEPVLPTPVVEKTVAEPVPTPAPVVAPPPAPPVESNLPVSEAKGYAGYLSNPAPEYPEIALERGWEGAVLLRVKVSPSGSPLSVDVKKGSGKKALDDAAVRTVKKWKFSPAMRGDSAIEGWVDVPINFKLPS